MSDLSKPPGKKSKLFTRQTLTIVAIVILIVVIIDVILLFYGVI